MVLYQTKAFLHSKGNHGQNEKTTYWMGEGICQWYIPHKGKYPKFIENL